MVEVGGIKVLVGAGCTGDVGGMVGVTGVAVPAEAQPTDRTRKKIRIKPLNLNTGVPPFPGLLHSLSQEGADGGVDLEEVLHPAGMAGSGQDDLCLGAGQLVVDQ